MIFSPAARRARPVSVTSTMQSTMSGTLASVAPCDSRMSASMPCSAKNRRVELRVLARHPHALRAGRPPLSNGDVLRHGDHDPERAARRLRVVQLAEDHHVAGGLLDPVAPGDAEVEQALGHVGGDLLRAQDPHLVDARVVDRRLVVDRRRALDAEVGRLEQLEGGLLERALGQDEAQHDREGRRWPRQPGNPMGYPGGASVGTTVSAE